jgi:hypothetical protein
MLHLPDRVLTRDRHPADGIENFGGRVWRGHQVFTYCDGLASNFVLQILAQK